MLVIVARIVLMPVIAGISYEITVKWAGSHPDNPLVKVILWPGMQMQYLTTHEPDDAQMECCHRRHAGGARPRGRRGGEGRPQSPCRCFLIRAAMLPSARAVSML